MFLLNYETMVDAPLRDVRAFTPAFCQMKPGSRALDVCCGTGAQVLEYGRHGIEAAGIDIDPNMLRVAARNRIKQKLPNVSFYLAEATALPLPDNFFDYVSISLALHDKSRPVRYKVVSEMLRVIRPTGTLILIDYPVPTVSRRSSFLYSTIEYFAGGDHYQGFKDFISSGGIDNVVKAFGLTEDKRAYLKGGLLVIVTAKIRRNSIKM